MERLFSIIRGCSWSPIELSPDLIEEIRQAEGVISFDLVTGEGTGFGGGAILVVEGKDRKEAGKRFLAIRNATNGVLPYKPGQTSTTYSTIPQE